MAATASPSSPLIPKDPPSYESLYLTIPQSSTQSAFLTDQGSHSAGSAIQRFIYRQAPFLQRLAAATFVATTVSTTVMLLLWQLQNLTAPEDPDRPWFDPDSTTLAA
ncbi:hypothetical protein O0I10_003728 [Lichtheimia ornata]|uniref:Uncharacterized protein n=1 Tax=Lichtheimia ornata TaxID=688661 RepID=A0AAD7XZW4_9FUNG|nr:uncharacterized protein O0I10_003728 [Lichtheimia ornata]KAJ8660680.1 hypothetical protein O0I10_003728 [Lichtheimia ornata]